MKKRIVLMGVAGALTAAALIGGSLAYFQADGGGVRQQISTRTLKISLKDAQTGDAAKESVLFKDAMPGETIGLENKLVVENTGDTPLYTRVTVSRSWGEESQGAFKKEYGKDSAKIRLTSGDGWYVMDNRDGNEENLYLYYTEPLGVKERTTSVLKGLAIAKDLTNEYADKGIQLDVEVDAVQASESETARQDAILAEWGVWAEFDGDGRITGIEE